MITDSPSPKWNSTTKIFVCAFVFILILLALWRFSTLIGPLVIAGIIAYVFNPLILLINRHTPLSRSMAIAAVYILFALLVLAALVAAGVTITQQAYGLVAVLREFVEAGPDRLSELINESFQIGTRTFTLSQLNLDLAQVSQQLFATIQPILSRSGQFIGQAASATVNWIGWAIFIYVLSIYFAIDLPRFGGLIGDAAHQPGYRRDVEHLLHQFTRIWNGYLRGQTLLAVIMTVLFTLTMMALGVRFALVLGILAGILEFIPFIGPFIVVSLSVLVAVFQGGNWLGLSPVWFGVVVLLAGLTLQQVEGNWLNPRVVGSALGLHPMLVMVGALMGGILGGVLGIMLAAPVMATIKFLGTYTWRKMFDLDPFPEPETILSVDSGLVSAEPELLVEVEPNPALAEQG
jgi:predicted PurR-regulated permease PerM